MKEHVGFDYEECWIVEWITSSRFFMPALSKIMPVGSVVYLECHESSYDDYFSELLPYLDGHRCPQDKIEPVMTASVDPNEVFTEHLLFGDSLIDSFEKFFTEWNYPHAHHVHGYHNGELIFWFHDAFIGGDLYISRHVKEDQISQFCAELAPKWIRRSETDWYKD